MINKLPHWVLINKFPAFNDLESLTAIEQTARIYGKINELIESYNKFADETNKIIEDHELNKYAEVNEFICAISCLTNNYINTVDMKIDHQNRQIAEVYERFSADVINTLKLLISDLYSTGKLDNAIYEVLDNIDQKINTFKTDYEATKEALNNDYEATKEALRNELSARGLEIFKENSNDGTGGIPCGAASQVIGDIRKCVQVFVVAEDSFAPCVVVCNETVGTFFVSGAGVQTESNETNPNICAVNFGGTIAADGVCTVTWNSSSVIWIDNGNITTSAAKIQDITGII